MKKTKILLTTLVLLSLVICVVAPNISSASGSVGFVVESKSALAGETVNIAINITQDSAMSAATFFLNFDSTKLDYVSATAGGILSSGLSDVVFNDADHKINLAYINVDPMNSAGSILNIQFKVKAEASVSDADMTLTVDELTNNTYNNLPFTITQGKISIISLTSPSPSPTVTPTETPTETPTLTPTPTPTATPIAVSGVKLNKATATLKVGQTCLLTATILPSNASNKAVTWTSSNTKVAIVSSSGKVTAKLKGTVTITAKTVSGGKIATCKITVLQPVTSVKLNKTTLTLKKGKTFKLIATVYPANANNKKVTWKSGSKAIASVSSTGIVKGIKKGTTYIYVYTVDGKKTARCRVTIK